MAARTAFACIRSLQFTSRSTRRLSLLQKHLAAGRHFSVEAMDEEVIVERCGNAAVITLNRPKALNALNMNMIKIIYPQLKMMENDPDVKVIIMKGAGDKAFCAGGDIRAVADGKKSGNTVPSEFFREEYKLNYAIGTLKTPYVALIHGITMGGGVGLSVHGMFRVATGKTVFAMPETAIGFFPDVGGGHFLPRLHGRLGLYLALTGTRLRGRDVQLAGVATHYVDADKIGDLESQLMSVSSDNALEIGKILDDVHQKSSSEEADFSLKKRLNQINRCFESNSLEGIMDALHADGSDWAKEQLVTLNKMSPTSMKVTIRELEEGRRLNLKEDLEMEYRISQRFMDGNDFFEGVRAVLVDRDNSPKWKPSSISAVTQDEVGTYFQSLGDQDLNLQ
ncbi:3-hydroxyisobutyryl-CoA hydrolase, mitochondrial-like [Corticium candelabrum]|uniref:3-hydroxyisobutyryl-CoA hydrolase, mitochondrial-like n=1 Tax=Corticium candelabrum TaxID=121492 RepID=UPI002E26C1F6|nr:3-hydroxyisobutyryl-CoA hydrolase, mitochondrial-like [Corticium candelabrum]